MSRTTRAAAKLQESWNFRIDERELNRYFKSASKSADKAVFAFLTIAFLVSVGLGIFLDTAWILYTLTFPGWMLFTSYWVLSGGRSLNQVVLSFLTILILVGLYGQLNSFEVRSAVYFVGMVIFIFYRSRRIYIYLLLSLMFVSFTFFILGHYAGINELRVFTVDINSSEGVKQQVANYFMGLSNLGICMFLSELLRKNLIFQIKNRIYLKRQSEVLTKNLRFAERLRKMDFEYEGTSEQDNDLSKALNGIKDSLVKAGKDRQINNFIAEGGVLLSETLRKYRDSIDSLAHETLHTLTSHMNMDSAVFYVLDQKKGVFTERAGYAASPDGLKEVKAGDGPLGHVIETGQVLILKNVPADYRRVSSSLGSGQASELLIFPIMRNDEVLGIIEMMSFKPIETYKKQFVEGCVEVIGSALELLLHRRKDEEREKRTTAMIERLKNGLSESQRRERDLKKELQMLFEENEHLRRLTKKRAQGGTTS